MLILAALVLLGAVTATPALGAQAKPQTTTQKAVPRAAAQAQQRLRTGPDLVLSGFAVTRTLEAQGTGTPWSSSATPRRRP